MFPLRRIGRPWYHMRMMVKYAPDHSYEEFYHVPTHHVPTHHIPTHESYYEDYYEIEEYHFKNTPRRSKFEYANRGNRRVPPQSKFKSKFVIIQIVPLCVFYDI